jgi:hypothetical protein
MYARANSDQFLIYLVTHFELVLGSFSQCLTLTYLIKNQKETPKTGPKLLEGDKLGESMLKKA